MSDEKIDLSSLDPSRDPVHWELQIAAVVARGLARRRAASSVAGVVLAWARPSIAVSAVAAVIVWVTVAIFPVRPPPAASGSPTAALSAWASANTAPSTAEILETFGRGDGTE